ncbi:MAG TPA: hypothetical protein PKY55_11960 [bacterium]|nr:hypothetical protein [bacterium]HPM60386.1 hypothetical protein [bacterium]
MQRCIVILVGLVALFTIGCSKEKEPALAPARPEAVAFEADVQAFAWTVMDQAGWSLEATAEEMAAAGTALSKGGPAPVSEFQRTIITGNIALYTFRMRVGPGPYDVIGLNRVVKERRPFQPIKTSKSLFFQHGSSKTFVGMMLPGVTSPTTPDNFGMGVFLARNDIDVWGIDQAWALVPASETNTDFMIDWGLARQMNDLRTAVGVARLTRIMTGCGNAKMILAGYSNGVPTTIALVNEETQLPTYLRNIGGYIPIDNAMKVDGGAMKEALIWYSTTYFDLVAAGNGGEPVYFAAMADAVRNNPDGHDLNNPDVSNLDFVLNMVAGPTLFPGHPFHYWAATWADGKPTGLRFTDWELWLDFLASGTAWEPYIWTAEWCGYVAGTFDTPYDDHLGEIRVPILNLTPAGGYADATFYGLSLLGSRDKETIMPSMGGPVEQEFAHIDLFTAPEAVNLVWQPMLRWIRMHTPGF